MDQSGTAPCYVSGLVSPATYPCPSCGFLVFDELPGSYAICELCNWEDDHVQLRHPTMGGGANSESLVEYQRIALERWPLSVTKLGYIERDPLWRPFEAADAREADVPTTGVEYFVAAAGDSPDYYWRR
jgi:hypothetical protein